MSEIAADDPDPMDVDISNSSSSTPMPVTPTRPKRTRPNHNLSQSQGLQQQKRRPDHTFNGSKKASSVPPPSPHRPSYPHSHTEPDIQKIRNHNRTPSDTEGVFHMSSDEEHSLSQSSTFYRSTGAAGINLNPNVRSLFGLGHSSVSALRSGSTSGTTTPLGTPPRAVPFFAGDALHLPNANAMSTSLDKATFFASAMFQNSPSPDELPDPLLLWVTKYYRLTLWISFLPFRYRWFSCLVAVSSVLFGRWF